MKITLINPTNYYTCQFCFKDFKSDKEYIIIQEYSPLCSNLCLFRFIYRILRDYDEKMLNVIEKHFNINQKSLSLSQKRAYNLTKLIIKKEITNINIEAQGSGSKKQAQIPEQIQAQAQHIPYKGMLSLLAEPKLDGGSSYVK